MKLCRRCQQREPLTPHRRYCEQCREERPLNRKVNGTERRVRWATRICEGCHQPSWRLIDGCCLRCVETGVAARVAREISVQVEREYRRIRRSGRFTVTPDVAYEQPRE